MGRSPYRHLGSDLCSARTGARGQVLVISAFPVNRIIIAHSIERIYRKPRSVEPSAAVDALSDPDICLVVLDATGEPDELAPTFARLEELRDSANPPRILLIAKRKPGNTGPSAATDFPADELIHTPFSPDTVQSAADQLLRGPAYSPYEAASIS